MCAFLFLPFWSFFSSLFSFHSTPQFGSVYQYTKVHTTPVIVLLSHKVLDLSGFLRRAPFGVSPTPPLRVGPTCISSVFLTSLLCVLTHVLSDPPYVTDRFKSSLLPFRLKDSTPTLHTPPVYSGTISDPLTSLPEVRPSATLPRT